MKRILVNTAKILNIYLKRKIYYAYHISYYKNEFDRLVTSNSANGCTWDETYGSIPNLSDQDSIYVDEIVDKIINKAVLIDEDGKYIIDLQKRIHIYLKKVIMVNMHIS